jgi:hypothetical protein
MPDAWWNVKADIGFALLRMLRFPFIVFMHEGAAT